MDSPNIHLIVMQLVYAACAAVRSNIHVQMRSNWCCALLIGCFNHRVVTLVADKLETVVIGGLLKG